jgi:hypothetical protein
MPREWAELGERETIYENEKGGHSRRWKYLTLGK